MNRIVIRGARQHNLKNIDLDIPRGALVVFSGPSGSGKSSLVFDTIYQESRRRFLETLPAYVQQFMERMPRPEFDTIEGLSPAVAVGQNNPVKSARSTVGTLTEIHDYLRLAFARAGDTFCPDCGVEVKSDTARSVQDRLENDLNGGLALICFQPTGSARMAETLAARGFIRGVINAEPYETFRLEEIESRKIDTNKILVIVDRIEISSDSGNRLAEAIQTAFFYGEGAMSVIARGARYRFSRKFACGSCGRPFREPRPSLFSFNNPYGACPSCRGFGAILDYDLKKIIPDQERTLAGGALDPWTKPRYTGRRESLAAFCAAQDIDMNVPWKSLSEENRLTLIHGKGRFSGIIPFLKNLESKKYKQYIRFFLRSYQSESPCPACEGKRLSPEALSVLLAGVDIATLSELSIDEFGRKIPQLEKRLSPSAQEISHEIFSEIARRTEYLQQVGLGYLSLARMTRTLSGGEYQRIMLTRLLGTSLTDTIFVLDEPTVGLHQRDTLRLLGVIRKLVENGNTLLVVEHDRTIIEAADYHVELGPASGEHGGELVHAGAPDTKNLKPEQSLKKVAGLKKPSHKKGGKPARPFLKIRGAAFRNLVHLDADFALGAFNCLTGVSGSGKSSLIGGIIYPALYNILAADNAEKLEMPGEYSTIEGQNHLSGVSMIDQRPIGKTPRSNPATYLKAFDEIRREFSRTELAERMGYQPGYFSFNTVGGRCERCKGAGYEQIEMQFMADVFVPCEQCSGKRYGNSALAVRYKGINIAEALDLTVNGAIELFGANSRIGKPLWMLQSVGLGYLKLGQSATTLSGGESQRLKIARLLSETSTGKGQRKKNRGTLYILDEPTTGLHRREVDKLLAVLDRLVDSGNTVLVVEHHPEVIVHADWIVDIGPEAGAQGGRLVVQGNPRDVAACKASRTGAVIGELIA